MREYIAEGVHVDDKGRAWTADSEGIVIRSLAGKVVGAVNRQYLLADTEADANSYNKLCFGRRQVDHIADNEVVCCAACREGSLCRNSVIVN
jgi:hypothetical protein